METDSFYFYYAALPIIVAGLWFAWRIVHSPFGRVLVSIRDNAPRARALGYDVDKYKVAAFVLSAGLAGLAGGLYAISHGFVSLQEVNWTTSGKVVLITVLGGIGTLWGGVVGAAIIIILEDQLASSGFEGIGIITGAVFVVVVLLFRRGRVGHRATPAGPRASSAAPARPGKRARSGPGTEEVPGPRLRPAPGAPIVGRRTRRERPLVPRAALRAEGGRCATRSWREGALAGTATTGGRRRQGAGVRGAAGPPAAARAAPRGAARARSTPRRAAG